MSHAACAQWPYQARILRRRGAAEAKVTIGPAMENVPTQFSTSVTVPFDASDEEVTADPEHKLPGKVAHPPSADDVQQALAQALIPKVDEAVIKWGAQRQVGGDLGDMQPGTRSWMVSVARHASSDRAIKLLSDIQETRSDILSQPLITYPVTMPEDSAKRCFTFAAISLDGKTDVNLKFGTPPPAGSKRMLTFGRDARSDPDAAFELCHIPKGQYVVAVSWGKERSPKGVLISMFDSTTGSATNDDTRAASRGLPTVPRKGEVLALNGSGLVQFKGTNNEVVSGKRGDRDGDGVEDERDRCPYDPETKNGYLDQDGCPDEVPEGFVATPEPMPAPAAPVAQPSAPATPPVAPASTAHRASKKP